MAEKVLESVKTRFFDKRIASGVLREEDLGETLFASLPSSGAAILRGL
jgi:N-acetylgalactosamine kinase